MHLLTRFAITLAIPFCITACDVAPNRIANGPRQATQAVVSVPAYAGPLVELHGSPADIGAQHAEALSVQIDTLQRNYLDRFIGTGARRFIALTTARLFKPYFLPEHLAEVDALAATSQMEEPEAVLAQCFLDLSVKAACSTITLPASAAPDHVARFARNLDFPSLNIADKYSTVFVYHPTGRYAFVSIGWPGMIGVLSGMNEHGLCLANMEVPRSKRLPGAMPYTLLYRETLERCKTVNEAIALIEKTPRQSANNLMLMDAAGDRAVLEITPEGVAVRRAGPMQPLISTNHQRGSDCDTPGRCWRYDDLHEDGAKEFGRIGVDQLETMLAQVSPGKATLQSMIFEPATRTIYLSTGASAATGPFKLIKAGLYFR
jgi:isopenicillin-N N-acyltransferase-like protein